MRMKCQPRGPCATDAPTRIGLGDTTHCEVTREETMHGERKATELVPLVDVEVQLNAVQLLANILGERHDLPRKPLCAVVPFILLL